MAQAQIRNHVGVGDESIAVQKAQRRRLDRPAQKQGKSLQRLRQIGNDYLADVAARGAVKYQPEGALPIVLADKHYGALKKGAVQLPAIQQQLAFKEFLSVRHSQA